MVSCDENIDDLIFRADFMLMRGEKAPALELYQLAHKVAPKNFWLRPLLAVHTPQSRSRPSQTELSKWAKKFEQPSAYSADQIYRMVATFPLAPTVWNLAGGAFSGLNDHANAARCFFRAVALAPDYVEAANNYGVSLIELGDLSLAEKVLKSAIRIRPNYAAAYNNIGNVFHRRGLLDKALEAFQRAISIDPQYQGALYNRANCLRKLGRWKEALVAYSRAQMCGKPRPGIDALMWHLREHLCEWAAVDPVMRLAPTFDTLGPDVAPFSMLSFEDCPSRQLERSKNWARSQFGKQVRHVFARPAQRSIGRPIKIGYFGADFHDHATLYLMAGVFRLHDKSLFDVTIYSYGRHKFGEWREQLKRNVTNFFDIEGASDADVVQLARSHELDIAVDLKGYTDQTRVGLFAAGLAPSQISYLGYPNGTLGAEFIDYIVADPILIPENLRQYYSENILFLPHSYQPNDNQRRISKSVTTKQDWGLPTHGVILCCMNNTYKITQCEFRIWMGILRKFPDSYLWLLKSNSEAEFNLKSAAIAHGVNHERLLFAERVTHSVHLERLRHADLFLDTFNINAHTTASDALWAGVPVITKLGKQFSARVGASLLTAVEMSELITFTEQEYEAKIVSLLQTPQILAGFKNRLAERKRTAPLFDTNRYTRNLEAGYRQILHRRCEGRTGDIHVRDPA